MGNRCLLAMFHSTDEADDKEMKEAIKIYTQLCIQKYSKIMYYWLQHVYKHLIFYVGMSKKDPSFPHITCSGNFKKKKNLIEIDDELINHYQKWACNKCPNIFRKFV